MKRFFICLFLFIIFTFQIPITSLYPDNKLPYYESLLSKLSNSKKFNSEILLQKTLLKKIINIINSKTKNYKFNLNNINTSSEYVDKFLEIVSIYSNYLQSLDELKEKEKRLQLLEDQISTMDNSTPNYLTLKLQHDFYYYTLVILKKRISYIESNYIGWLKSLSKKIDDISFKNSDNSKIISYLKNQVEKNYIKIEELKIDKERLQLLNKDKEVKRIEGLIDYVKEKNYLIVQKLIRNYLIQFFIYFKSKDKKVFQFKSIFEKLLAKYSNDKYYVLSLNYSIQKIMELRFGTKEILLHDTKKTIKNTVVYIFSLLNKPLFSINNKGISSLDIIIAIVIFILGIFIGTLYKKYINKLTYKGISLTPSTKILISNIGYYLIVTIAFFITLKVIGIDLSSLTVIVGALSVGIGFGLQSVISNFICGLIMLFEKSIKVDDIIELNEDLIGKVASINMRATIVTTFDNIDIIIPNQTLFQNNVINWTMSDNIRRLRVPFGVAYGTDVDKVQSVVLAELFESDIDFIRKDENKKPRIVMTEMADSSVNFELFVWVEIKENKSRKIMISEFLILIYKALYKHNIEIPFPQIDVHFKK